jgi:hypothetical protein
VKIAESNCKCPGGGGGVAGNPELASQDYVKAPEKWWKEAKYHAYWWLKSKMIRKVMSINYSS